MAEEHSTRRGRPSSFERSELIAVALDLGPDNLALTKVAEALSVPRTTVYNQVRSPEELGRLVLSSILGEFQGTRPAGTGPWQTQLEQFALSECAALLAAGPWLRFYEPEIHTRRQSLEMADHLIESLIEVGFSAEMAGLALTLVFTVVQEFLRLRGRDGNPFDGGADVLSHLDVDEFPWIAAAGAVRSAISEERQFRYNLQCVLAGIAAMFEDGPTVRSPRTSKMRPTSDARSPRR